MAEIDAGGEPRGRASLVLERRWARVLIAVAALSVGHVVHLSRSVGCMDFLHFWSVARSVRSGEARDIYDDAERRRLAQMGQEQIRRERDATADPLLRIELDRLASAWPAFHTYSTPWLYAVAASASSGAFVPDQARYQALSALLFALAIVLLARSLGHGPAETAILVTVLLLWYEPALVDMHVGNVNRLQLSALAAYAWVSARARGAAVELAAGAFLGATIAFKPNLAFVVVALGTAWIVQGAWRRIAAQAAGFVAGVASALALSTRFFGSIDPWLSWWRQMTQVLSPDSGGDYDLSSMPGNFSLARFVAGVAPRTIALVLLAGFAALLYLRKRRGASPKAGGLEILAIGVGAAASILASPIAWLHYYVLVLPLGLYLLRPTDADRAGARVRGGLAAASLVMVGLLPIKFFLPIGDRASGALVVLGVVALLALAAWDLLDRDEEKVVCEGAAAASGGRRRPSDLEIRGRLEHPTIGR
jgi:hypothetical protein